MGKRDSKSTRLRENNGSDQHFTEVRRSEVLANPSGAAKTVFRLLNSKEFAKLLRQPILENSASRNGQSRLTATEVDQLVADYGSHGSIYTLARKYKVHRGTVSQHLKERGVDLNRGMSQAAKEQAARLYADGMSSAVIGKQLGFDNHTVISALRTLGVPIRKPVASRS